jgi:hypothetical protein
MVPTEKKITQLIHGKEVLNKDAVVMMYQACKRAREVQLEQQTELTKLLERVNLDRPILQKEKIKLILYEKSPLEK